MRKKFEAMLIIFLSCCLIFLCYININLNNKIKNIDRLIEETNNKITYINSVDSQQNIQINQLNNQIYQNQQDEALKGLEQNTDESIFDNTPIEGLTPISEDEAREIWENYASDMNIIDLNTYHLNSVKKEKVRPTNRFTAGAEANVRTADFEREAYVFNYIDDRAARLEVTAYVDIYTGKVIGGNCIGD